MKVALVSLDQAWKDKNSNKEKCESVIESIKIAMPDIDLIVFPELTLTGFCVDDSLQAESGIESSETVCFFSGLSLQYQCHIIFGQLSCLDSGQIVNRQNITSCDGSLLAYYDKIHTFSYAGETEYITQGNAPTTFLINNTLVGASICYDLRFAELYHYYRNKAELVVNIANWPSTRTSQWLCLLQARAIENQYFVLGVNRVGIDGKGLNYESSSVIFNPLGEQLLPIVKGKQWDVYDINTEDVPLLRQRFPFVKDRRGPLYYNWSSNESQNK
ncbi:nitrilase-related carbon-nitrogen hydrolase [Aliivibrio wodanis]|uniref:nitrilase-related carbon-nitrogen hydrolase n=1 Tax=Aliivibrio wodanis TaxID=80852 RepID=UPI00406CB600